MAQEPFILKSDPQLVERLSEAGLKLGLRQENWSKFLEHLSLFATLVEIPQLLEVVSRELERREGPRDPAQRRPLGWGSEPSKGPKINNRGWCTE